MSSERQSTDAPPATGDLAVEDLSFRYRKNASRVLDRISDTFPAGDVTAITGASGSGKSTLLYTLGLMLVPEGGDVVLGGRRVGSLSDSERSAIRNSTIGFVFQDAMLDASRSILDNVVEPAIFSSTPRKVAVRRAQELLAYFGLTERSSHRPGEVSGGQAQRVALCRALVLNPSVILCDEPTGNLDRTATEVVWQFLLRQAESGATVVIATHDEELAQRAAKRIVVAG